MQTILLAALNHLLLSEAWPRERLRKFVDQTVHLEMPPFAVFVQITAEGLLRPAAPEASATVTLALPSDMPLRILAGLGDRASLLASAQIRGSAELADCLSFLFRYLDWDAESDLARVFGDIAARRLTQGGRGLIECQGRQASNLARNMVEYFTEENPSIARPQDIAEFCRDVAELATRTGSIEQRIASLQNRRSAR